MVSSAETKVIEVMKNAGIDLVATLPCEKVRNLLAFIPKNFKHIPLTREEEGIGICAGVTLASKKPALLVQSSGVGNFVNALCSLTKIYHLPLPILISWRGVYKEKIPAQVPIGRSLPKLFEAIEVPWVIIKNRAQIEKIKQAINEAFEKNMPYAILLHPALWGPAETEARPQEFQMKPREIIMSYKKKIKPPILTRYEVLHTITPWLSQKIVISNLGMPSKELYHILDQESNFYMLGSMGLASCIGLGIAIYTRKEIVVIEGDGSILMNPNALCTIAQQLPKNLTIVAIDNSAHGSTGNQPTATYELIDLELLAKSLGIKNTHNARTKKELKAIFESLGKGPRFVHVIAKPGNAVVPEVPLKPVKIKERVMRYLSRN